MSDREIAERAERDRTSGKVELLSDRLMEMAAELVQLAEHEKEREARERADREAHRGGEQVDGGG